MAERRMFAKTIVLSDAFLDMPMSARCLYFTLGMFADDDGFVNSPRGIMRQCGASDDDLKVLLAKKFLLAFESGVIVIKHWRINNYLQKDRYTPTKYLEEKATLTLDENSAYKEAKALSEDMYTQSVYTQVRLGKDSVGKDRLEEDNNTLTLKGSSVCATASPRRFTPPSLEEVRDYCRERGNTVDPGKFIDFYESKGWMVGKNKMKDWKAAVRTWERTPTSAANATNDRYANLRNLLEANKNE
jgi:hypothetical protein